VKPVRRGQSFTFEGDEPPREFCIFSRGMNESTKGPAVWDDAAIASVMARVAERGRVRYMMDLEHRAIDEQARVHSSDATDAMAWFDVELRGGELWATNVTWTPAGEERLRSKKQVYFSPAYYDDEQGRVLELVNVALTSLPATHDIPSLVAANRHEKKAGAKRARRVAIAIAERRLARMQTSCQRNTRKP
jgi:phage I-like protein